MSLVITRKIGQRIFIGPDIVIQIVDVEPRSNRVKLALVAPRELGIFREEIAPVEWVLEYRKDLQVKALESHTRRRHVTEELAATIEDRHEEEKGTALEGS